MKSIREKFTTFRIKKSLQRNMFDSTNHDYDSINFFVQHNDQYEDSSMIFSHRLISFNNLNVIKRSKNKNRKTFMRVKIKRMKTNVFLSMRQIILIDKINQLHFEHVDLKYQNKTLKYQNNNMMFCIESLKKIVKYELISKQNFMKF